MPLVSEEEHAGETGSYVFEQECLDRLSIAVGGNLILSMAKLSCYHHFSPLKIGRDDMRHW
jgi:hypothetical protein